MEMGQKGGAWRKLPWVRYPLVLSAPLVLLYLCQLVTLQDGALAGAWMDEHVQAVFLSYVLLLLLQLLLEALTGRFFCAALALGVPALLLSIASHLKEVVNGVPLLASDLAMVGQAGQIAGFLRPGMTLGNGTWQAIGLFLLLLVLAFCFSRPAVRSGGRGRALAAVLLASLTLNVALFPTAAAFLTGEESETQAQRNDRLGLLAGLYSAVRESAMREPAAYTEDNMHRVLNELRQARKEAAGAVSDLKPNVILLMSESFFDVTELPGVTFAEDPIPNFRSLARAFPGGKFLSNTYAGGTGNVEMEVMTGIPSAFPGAGEDLTSLSDRTAYSRVPSLVKSFQGQGYYAEMIHSYNDSLYNRAANLPALGFDKLVYSDGFPADAPMAGGYLSDDALADGLIAAFEKKQGPIFLYGLSMENHQPYYGDKFTASSGVEFSSDVLDEEGLTSLDALVHGLKDADASLKKLTDYFSRCEEPVILVFWGDHLPGLYLEDTDTIYSELGYSSTANTKDWDAQELKRMHTTDFLVWNNFGAALDVPEEISCTVLGSDILGWAGLEKPLYFTWVDRAAEEMLLYRERLFVAADGTAYEEVPDEASETVSLYRSIVYDILYGQGYISDELTDYGGDEGSPAGA